MSFDDDNIIKHCSSRTDGKYGRFSDRHILSSWLYFVPLDCKEVRSEILNKSRV